MVERLDRCVSVSEAALRLAENSRETTVAAESHVL